MTLLPSDLLWLASRAPAHHQEKPKLRCKPRISLKRRRMGFSKKARAAL